MPPWELHARNYFAVIKKHRFLSLDRQDMWFPVYKNTLLIKYIYIFLQKLPFIPNNQRKPYQGLRPTGGERASEGEGDSTKIH